MYTHMQLAKKKKTKKTFLLQVVSFNFIKFKKSNMQFTWCLYSNNG